MGNSSSQPGRPSQDDEISIDEKAIAQNSENDMTNFPTQKKLKRKRADGLERVSRDELENVERHDFSDNDQDVLPKKQKKKKKGYEVAEAHEQAEARIKSSVEEKPVGSDSPPAEDTQHVVAGLKKTNRDDQEKQKKKKKDKDKEKDKEKERKLSRDHNKDDNGRIDELSRFDRNNDIASSSNSIKKVNKRETKSSQARPPSNATASDAEPTEAIDDSRDPDSDQDETHNEVPNGVNRTGRRTTMTATTRTTGRWTADERALMEDLFQATCDEENISQNELTQRVAKWVDVTGFREKAAAAFPNRGAASIRKFCRRHWRTTSRGPWTEDEDKALRNAYVKKPKQWAEISHLVGRTGDDCRDRYTKILRLGEEREVGKWDSEDLQSLEDAVAECMAMILRDRVVDPRDADRASLEKYLNWEVVARKMSGHRAANKCRRRWRRLRDQGVVDEDGHISTSAKESRKDDQKKPPSKPAMSTAMVAASSDEEEEEEINDDHEDGEATQVSSAVERDESSEVEDNDDDDGDKNDDDVFRDPDPMSQSRPSTKNISTPKKPILGTPISQGRAAKDDTDDENEDSMLDELTRQSMSGKKKTPDSVRKYSSAKKSRIRSRSEDR